MSGALDLLEVWLTQPMIIMDIRKPHSLCLDKALIHLPVLKEQSKRDAEKRPEIQQQLKFWRAEAFSQCSREGV